MRKSDTSSFPRVRPLPTPTEVWSPQNPAHTKHLGSLQVPGRVRVTCHLASSLGEQPRGECKPQPKWRERALHTFYITYKETKVPGSMISTPNALPDWWVCRRNNKKKSILLKTSIKKQAPLIWGNTWFQYWKSEICNNLTNTVAYNQVTIHLNFRQSGLCLLPQDK